MKKNRKIYSIIIIFIILFIIIVVSVDEYKEKNIEKNKKQYDVKNLSSNYNKEIEGALKVEEIKENQKYPKEEVIEDYKGYKVSAKLEIPKIKLETYVLEEFSNDSLNVSVTKFWGPNPNEVGNLCIAGHNFQRKNMFRNLKKLEVGDTFYISDNKIGKLEYEVYELYRVTPDDISCLSQETEGKREVTLITCTNDSKKRIIVKAREVL